MASRRVWNGPAGRVTSDGRRTRVWAAAIILLSAASCAKPEQSVSGGDTAARPKSPRLVAQKPVPKKPDRRRASTKPPSRPNASPAVEAAADPTGKARPLEETAVPVHRPSDSRPRHDDAQLQRAGIQKYSSKRLLLYTDIAPELARPLPLLMDRAYEAWEAYFGPLPPDREGTDFQMTGYLMADRERFVGTRLLPEALPGFAHGRHRGAEFWMNDQADDYYRAHLVLHEGTHCFMTIVPNVMMPFVFYMEGMAELFGTHRTDNQGRVHFGIMPQSKEQFPGLGRIRMVHDDIKQTGPRELGAIIRLQPDAFLKNEAYAWSWALCQFLNTHPRYRDRFREVGKWITPANPLADLLRLFEADLRDLQEEWLLFTMDLCHGYDIERAAIDFKPGRPVGRMDPPVAAEIAADRGWQSSGAQVEQGRTYRVTASGRFSLAQEPKPWESEPQGVSIRYFDGKPLGMLVGTVRAAAPPSASPWTTMREAIPLGRDRTFVAPQTGTLYLRVNEFWNELADNRGTVSVKIQEAAEPPKANVK